MEDLSAFVREFGKVHRSGEALMGALMMVRAVNELLDRILEIDDQLAPELKTCYENLGKLIEALGRASSFVDARYAAAWERLGEE